MTATEKTAELKRIAEVLRDHRNDPQALVDYQNLVSRMTQAERRDLVVVLTQMMSEGK